MSKRGRFAGYVEDVLSLRHKDGLVLMLTGIENHPEVGMTVRVGEHIGSISELGRNSTDGQAVSYRSCLTGKPCSPYGSILVEWSGESPETNSLVRQWVKEEAKSDV